MWLFLLFFMESAGGPEMSSSLHRGRGQSWPKTTGVPGLFLPDMLSACLEALPGPHPGAGTDGEGRRRRRAWGTRAETLLRGWGCSCWARPATACAARPLAPEGSTGAPPGLTVARGNPAREHPELPTLAQPPPHRPPQRAPRSPLSGLPPHRHPAGLASPYQMSDPTP